MGRGQVSEGTGRSGAGRVGSSPPRVSPRPKAQNWPAFQNPSLRLADLGNYRPETGRPLAWDEKSGAKGTLARVVGGVLLRKELAEKPLQRVCEILGDTH